MPQFCHYILILASESAAPNGYVSSHGENDAYYYHPDHLGSSSTVTDKKGNFYEHNEFFPYGEVWVTERSGDVELPFKFTSKELDPETGLYYYGARYMDPRLGRFVSVDPPIASGEYFPVPPVDDKAKEKNGNLPGTSGVFCTVNLNVYNYASNNPIKYIDPDGKASWLSRNIAQVSPLKHFIANIMGPGHSLVSYNSGGVTHVAQYGEYGIRNLTYDHVGGPYKIKATGLNDSLMEQAVDAVTKTEEFKSDNYSLLFHNCNDFTSAVMKEYKALFIKDKMGSDTGFISRIKAEFSWLSHKSNFTENTGNKVTSLPEKKK